MERDAEDGIDISVSTAHRVIAYFHTCHPCGQAPDYKLRECLRRAVDYYGGGYHYMRGENCWAFDFKDESAVWLYDNCVVKIR